MTTITLQAYAAHMNEPPERGLPPYPFTVEQWATTIILHRLAEWAGNHPQHASTHIEAVTQA